MARRAGVGGSPHGRVPRPGGRHAVWGILCFAASCCIQYAQGFAMPAAFCPQKRLSISTLGAWQTQRLPALCIRGPRTGGVYMQELPGGVDAQLLLATAVSGNDAIRYFFAGGICCCISHGMTVPIDVVKTRMQTDPDVMQLSVLEAAKVIYAREGAKGLLAGFGSTIIGFSTSGAVKYGLYEVFKPFAQDFVSASPVLPNAPVLGFLLAGACAELVASTLLCPLEATRIRLVTDPTYGNEVFDALPRLLREEKWGIYSGLPAIMIKMVPGTMSQLASYEFLTRSAFAAATAAGISADSSTRFFITTACAVLAGVVSTLTSQPGDTVLSEMNKAGGQGQTIFSIVSRMESPKELFRGVQARLIHLLALITTQLVIYDYAKTAVGLATTGAK